MVSGVSSTPANLAALCSVLASHAIAPCAVVCCGMLFRCAAVVLCWALPRPPPSSPPCPLQNLGAIQHVACGAGHTCVVAEDGALYTTGCGSCGQLGHGPHVTALTTFKRVEALAQTPVALAACGEEFTCVVTQQRAVLTFGLGNVGQLGTGRLENVSTPCLVESMSDKQVELVGCSQGQVVAISRTGEVYSWGLPSDRMRFVRPSVLLGLSLSSSSSLVCVLWRGFVLSASWHGAGCVWRACVLCVLRVRLPSDLSARFTPVSLLMWLLCCVLCCVVVWRFCLSFVFVCPW